MNTKKNKNKNKSNKPANPSPPQKIENVKAVEKEEVPEEKSELVLKSDERVPEIISEVVTSPVEAKVSEDDTPKKPKRNRGKKKKTDKEEDVEDNLESGSKMQESITAEVTGELQKEETLLEKSDDLSITPTARKKKNKNKKQAEHWTEDEKMLEKETKLQVKDTVKTEADNVAEVGQEIIDSTEFETKTARKKNKKKKRTDSEKSDKTEDVPACTAAFQKLLEARDDKKDIKVDIKEEETSKTTPDNLAICESLTSELKYDTSNIVEEISKIKCISEINPQEKKKNKKDKKHPPKAEIEEEIKDLTKFEPAVIDSTNQTTTDQLDIKLPIDKIIDPSSVKKTEDTKPKANIAKPVDKKRKGKSDASLVENVSDQKSLQEEKPITSESLKDISEEEVNLSEVSKTIPCEYNTDKKNDESQNIKIIQTPECEMGKKRNKPPKIIPIEAFPEVCKSDKNIKSQESSQSKESIVIYDPTLLEYLSNPEIVNTPTSEPDTGKKRKSSPKPKSIETVSVVSKSEQNPETTKPSTADERANVLIIKDEPLNPIVEKMQIPELEINKKGKKSPKPSKIFETISEVTKFDSNLGLKESLKQVELVDDSTKIVKKEILPTVPETIPSSEIEKTERKSPKSSISIDVISEMSELDKTLEPKGTRRPIDATATVETTKHEMPNTEIEKILSSNIEKEESIKIPELADRDKNLKAKETLKPKDVIDNSAQIVKDAQTTVTENLPSQSGKKGKKSPKPPKSIETMLERKEFDKNLQSKESVKYCEEIDKSTQAKDNLPQPVSLELIIGKDSTKITTEVKAEMIVSPKSCETKNDDKVASLQTDDKIKSTSEESIPKVSIEQLSSKDLTLEEGDLKMPELETIYIPEGGMGKKRKKSPKPHRKLDSKESLPKSQVLPQDDSREKTDSSFYPLSLEDIEIRSIIGGSKDLGCDSVSDIQYSRSTNQLLDNNNNMIIQDVTRTTATESSLKIPLIIPDTPLVQCSEESSMAMSQLIPTTGLRITDIDTSVVKSEEKTDLKSKMMEVNKDMEGLRISIEKSLAELTTIESSEKDIDKQFEESQRNITEKIESTTQHDTFSTKENILAEVSLFSSEISNIKTTQAEVVVSTAKDQETTELLEPLHAPIAPPVCPSRKDNKGKGKSKKKGKQENEHHASSSTTTITTASSECSSAGSKTSESKDSSKDSQHGEKTEQKSESTQKKGKQQSTSLVDESRSNDEPQDSCLNNVMQASFEPIENFEDAMTSSLDDVNKTFEMIANEANHMFESNETNENNTIMSSQNNPEISVTAPIEEDEKANSQGKVNPVSQPKNLLGHPDIPARLNKTDYKKEKNKPPNTKQAKVKIKDAVPIEINKQSKESQTENKRKLLKDQKLINETITCMTNENEEFIYKYSFRKVFLPSACHICKKELKGTRVACNFCNLIFYCSPKHKDEDYPQHQGLCFAVSTIVHLKDQKYIYADSKNVTGHDYRLLRMQMIISCEKVLKRKLVPWEQEALLYPRVCADMECREWRQERLRDCEGCGQISYCSNQELHLPKTHQRWCKSYSLYQKLVSYQQTKGRLEPKLPTRVMMGPYQIPDKINEVLASLYEEKIDMNDIQYAALTQIATAPLTAAYCHQLYNNKMNATYANGIHKKSSFTIHVVGAELQFEADALNKWEVFFLHLRPDVRDLRVVLIGPELNPSKLPLELLGKINLCEYCRQNKRRVVFDFQDKKTYSEYWSTDFIIPDLVCAFNSSIQRSSIYNSKDTWPTTIKCIAKLKVPFLVTSYTLSELQRDLARIKECADVGINTISEANYNSFASVRPDRNFISDHEMPLLFKNYCFTVVCGAF